MGWGGMGLYDVRYCIVLYCTIECYKDYCYYSTVLGDAMGLKVVQNSTW
jgi:hypothetical protein